MISMFDVSKYLGVPYKKNGYDLSGLDCWGLVHIVYRDLGIGLPVFPWAYDFTKIVRKEEDSGKWVKINELKKFCVCLFRRYSEIDHCGVYIGKNRVLHATARLGVANQKIEQIEKIYERAGNYIIK